MSNNGKHPAAVGGDVPPFERPGARTAARDPEGDAHEDGSLTASVDDILLRLDAPETERGIKTYSAEAYAGDQTLCDARVWLGFGTSVGDFACHVAWHRLGVEAERPKLYALAERVRVTVLGLMGEDASRLAPRPWRLSFHDPDPNEPAEFTARLTDPHTGEKLYFERVDLADPRRCERFALVAARTAGCPTILFHLAAQLAAKAKSVGVGPDAADAPEEAEAPAPISFERMAEENPTLRPPVIDGIARQGETVNVIAPPKKGKSWLVNGLALSVASGYPWLARFDTMRGRVLIIDNELHRPTIVFRMNKVAAAMGLSPDDWKGRIDVLPVRGMNITIDRLRHILATVERGAYTLVILDALYKFTPRGMDENSNADMSFIYGLIDSYAELTGAAFILIHHASKGVQGGKAVTDVGSGAGAISRSADAHVILRDHEEEDCVVMQAEVRNFARPEPLPLRWEFPQWRPAPDLDPTKLKRESGKGGRPPKNEKKDGENPPAEPWTAQRFAAEFCTDKPTPARAITSKAARAVGSDRQAGNLLAEAEAEGLIFRHKMPSDPRTTYYSTKAQGEIFESHTHTTRTPRTPRKRRQKESPHSGK